MSEIVRQAMEDGFPIEAPMQVPCIMPDGRSVDLLNLASADIDFAEVAASLSKLARFNGRHRGAAISVAQHSVMGADALYREHGDAVLSGYFLLHDAHEYLIGDIARPAILMLNILVSRCVDDGGADGFRMALDQAKSLLDRVIIEAAELPAISMMPLYARQVAEMDERMCLAEARALYGSTGPVPLVECNLPPPKLVGGIVPWGAAKAEIAFLDRLERYLGIVARPQ